MKLKTRDDERVFVLLLLVLVLLSLCFRGRILLLLSYFLLLHRLKIFHFKGTLNCLVKTVELIHSQNKENTHIHIEYARVFSLSNSLSRKEPERDRHSSKIKADLFHSGE